MIKTKKITITNNKIIIIGIGGIGKCISHHLECFFNYKWNNLYLIDMDIKQTEFPTIKKLLENGVNFIHYHITDSNYKDFFESIIEPNTIVIDCSSRTSCIKWLKFLFKKNIWYINTSIEQIKHKNIYLNSISHQHKQIDELNNNENIKAKMLLEYGMNPGLITSLCYKGLDDLAKHLNKKITTYADFAESINITEIICSEIDTQRAEKIDTKKYNNTWSVVCLIDETFAGSEIYLGNEYCDQIKELKNMKENQIHTYLDTNPILLTKKCAKDNVLETVCYSKNITKKNAEEKQIVKINKDFAKVKGYLMQHGEVLDIGTMLKNKTYSPTVYFIYNINTEANNFIISEDRDKIIEKSYNSSNNNVMTMLNNKLNGTDNIGVYIKTYNNINWWCGTVLETDFTKNKIKEKIFGPTTLQVMCGVLSGLSWLMSQNKGIYYGRHVDHKYILKKIGKYINIKSMQVK